MEQHCNKPRADPFNSEWLIAVLKWAPLISPLQTFLEFSYNICIIVIGLQIHGAATKFYLREGIRWKFFKKILP
jgi:hypothetical protein